MQGLLNEEEAFEKVTQAVVLLYRLPEGLEVGDALKLLVAIQGKGKVFGGV